MLVASISMPGPSGWLLTMECIMKPPASGSSGPFSPTRMFLALLPSEGTLLAPLYSAEMTCLATPAVS